MVIPIWWTLQKKKGYQSVAMSQDKQLAALKVW
jgi:hypothetical protein